jgi:hypothetical protein
VPGWQQLFSLNRLAGKQASKALITVERAVRIKHYIWELHFHIINFGLVFNASADLSRIA